MKKALIILAILIGSGFVLLAQETNGGIKVVKITKEEAKTYQFTGAEATRVVIINEEIGTKRAQTTGNKAESKRAIKSAKQIQRRNLTFEGTAAQRKQIANRKEQK